MVLLAVPVVIISSFTVYLYPSLKHFKPTPGLSNDDAFAEAVRYIRTTYRARQEKVAQKPKAPPNLTSIFFSLDFRVGCLMDIC